MNRPALGGAAHVVTLTMNPALDLTVQVPHLTLGAVNSGEALHWDAAGKGVNVASILSDALGLSNALGAEVSISVTGLLGQGNPERFEQLFKQKKLNDHFVRVPGDTRVGIKLADPQRQHTTDINLSGIAATPQALTEVQRRLLALAQPGSLVVLAGSLPPGVPSHFYADLIVKLRAQGCLTVLDTSGPALSAALLSGPTIAKPNVHELSAALGRELSSEAEVLQAAGDLLSSGSELVAVSRGEEGALLSTRAGAVRAAPVRVQVISTVGAGDAMVAGLVTARLRGLTLPETARLATAYSLGAITRLGAHLPPAAELDAFAQQVQVQDIPPPGAPIVSSASNALSGTKE